ncbi:MAG: DUF4286 family protein [Saprospiraceae bacterium]
MIVYNVTVKIDLPVAEEWLEWMRSEHIPEVLATGLFVSYRMLRIMNDQDKEGTSYAIQYTCKDNATLQAYFANYAPALQKKHKERYNNSYIAIRTLMKVVEEKVLFSSDS